MSLLENSFHIDFETRSNCDLRKGGPWVYSEHWSTEVWCCAYALGQRDVQMWWPGDPLPPEMLQAYFTGVPFLAHNAGFERAIFANIMHSRYGWPVPALDRWVCTASMAAAMGLPRGLDAACTVMGVPQQKDNDGHPLMLRMARPRSRTTIRCIVCGMMACDHHEMFKTVLTWWDDQERKNRLAAYCMQDVRAERALTHVLRPLSQTERMLWLHNEIVNERGVAVDLKFVRAAARLVKDLAIELNEQVRVATNSFASATTQTKRLRIWLAMYGLALESLRKNYLAEKLKTDLNPDFKALIELRLEGSKSSTAKLNALINRTSIDGRARDNLMYHGAGTGRISGRGFQPHNLPRPIMQLVRYIEECIALVSSGCDLATFKEALARWQADQNTHAADRKEIPIEFRGLDMISVCLRPCLVAAGLTA
jgi:DNA polymerase